MATQVEKQTRELTLDELIDQTIAIIPEDRPPGVMEQMKYVRGYNAIWKAWTKQEIEEIKESANKQTTFATDGRDYTDAQYRDILTTATLRKARLIDNEFCVFSDKKGNPKVFFQKDYWRRRLFEIPGFTDFSWTMGEVMASPSGRSARVACTATWKLNGRQCEIECIKTDKADGRLTVKMYEKDGPDLLIGKAEARLFAKVHHTCTGSLWAAADAADETSLDAVIQETEGQQAADEATGPHDPNTDWRTRALPEGLLVRLESAVKPEHIEKVRDDLKAGILFKCPTPEAYEDAMAAVDGRLAEIEASRKGGAK